MKRIVLYLCCIVMTSGCTHIVFDVPQPRDGDVLGAFPPSFRGVYQADDETTDSLMVGKTTVTFVQHTIHEIPLTSVDTMLHISLKDDLLYDANMMFADGVPYEIDDTLIRYEYYDRFVIGISDTMVVKENGKYLIINSNMDDDDLEYWDVVLVHRLNSGDLVVNTIGNLRPPGKDDHSRQYDADVEDFRKFAPYEQLDDNTFLFSPTPDQFRKLILKKMFSEKQMYRRIY